MSLKKELRLSVSKLPDPSNGRLNNPSNGVKNPSNGVNGLNGVVSGVGQKRVSISDSVTSDSTDISDVQAASTTKMFPPFPKKSKHRRCRKRLSTLLHTHVALILVCTLAALDAACVIGQIICDILIMKETLHDWDSLDDNLTSLLWQELPWLNASHDDPSGLDLQEIRDILWQHQNALPTNLTALSQQLAASGIVMPPPPQSATPQGVPLGVPPPENGLDPRWLEALTSAASRAQFPAGQSSGNFNVSLPLQNNASTVSELVVAFFKVPVAHSRGRRAVEGGTEEHDLLHELTHAFHLGSMIILSILLLETLLKVFAMGRKVLNHKLEIFDAFVVSVSWALDVAFWEGIWAHPGTEAATILIFILPWRVVRIVNSFVLVIQEKDHVQLKIVKQRLRLSAKKSKESVRKAHSYRTEVRQLQGLCRKYGATDNEIGACGPTGRTGRRRSSLMPAMERAASLTLISALGSHPSLYTMGSSSEDEDDLGSRQLGRTVSQDPTLRSAFSVSTLDSVFTIEGGKNEGYLTSDTEEDKMSVATGINNAVFVVDDEQVDTPRSRKTSPPHHRGGLDSAEVGRASLARRLHKQLTAQASDVTVVSELSASSSSGEGRGEDREGDAGSAGGSPEAEIPQPRFDQNQPQRHHQLVSKQDSNTRL